jgi:hypothetical protein
MCHGNEEPYVANEGPEPVALPSCCRARVAWRHAAPGLTGWSLAHRIGKVDGRREGHCDAPRFFITVINANDRISRVKLAEH